MQDLAGNVWEWCLNRYDEPQNVAIDGTAASRAVRGGSWAKPLVIALAVGRNAFPSLGRNDGLGFRLCSSLPIS